MKIPKQSPLKQISVKTICFCHPTNCAIWLLRFCMFPSSVIREQGMKSFLIRTISKKGKSFDLIQ